MQIPKNTAIVIVGPTSSGKTRFGHYIATKYNGEIVNADSMQIYAELPIITSSPSNDLTKLAAYHLYNFLPITSNFSIVKYAQLAASTVRQITARNKLPIIVGGSGLYISTLINGYSPIPQISESVKREVKALYQTNGCEGIYKYLHSLDTVNADKINSNDSQRLQRALEVMMQTGKSIFSYNQQANILPLPEYNFKVNFLFPERDFLYSLINFRASELIKHGAIEEVARVKDLLEEKNCLALKALGVQEILQFLGGDITKENLIELIATNTRRYAKRQITWFKHQIEEKAIITYDNELEFETKLSNYKINL